MQLARLEEIIQVQGSDQFASKTVADLVVNNLDDCLIEWTVGDDTTLCLGNRLNVLVVGDLQKRYQDVS